MASYSVRGKCVSFVKAVEEILGYSFKDKSLLEKALTHPSYSRKASYQRLEFLGDAALGLAFTNFVFLAFPNLDQGNLSLIRSANISTEKLARVAVTTGIYKHLLHNVTSLNEKIQEFCEMVQQEDNTVVHGGAMKAPKVLADIVESLVAAIYVDLCFDLKALWLVIRGLLEPIVTPDMLHQQPQPVTMLFEVCQRDGKEVAIKQWRDKDKNIATVFVDGNFIVSATSEQKENAKLHAAKAALEKLSFSKMNIDISEELDENGEIEAAKQKLHDICCKRKWAKPSYSIKKEVGPPHDRKFVCSVKFEVEDAIVYVEGEEKLRVRDAERSAASVMLQRLRAHNYI